MRGKKVGDARLIYIFAATVVLVKGCSWRSFHQCSWSFIHTGTQRAQLVIRHSIRHCADISHSIFTGSATKVLLAPSSSRSSAAGTLSNFLKLIATELQKLDLKSYELQATCCCACAKLPLVCFQVPSCFFIFPVTSRFLQPSWPLLEFHKSHFLVALPLLPLWELSLGTGNLEYSCFPVGVSYYQR